MLGTLAAVAVAAPAYRGFQEAIDRRFNRRRFDALTRVRDYLHDPDPGVSVDEVLRQALEDPTLDVMYWAEDGGHWVLGDGRHTEPGHDDVRVNRQGRPGARLRVAERLDRELVRSVAEEATPELENAMLRARISLQLTEVRESRSRIAAASLAERRRLERNLHDGAQQRLLALALELQAAQFNGTPERLRQAVGDGIGALQAAVVELRELTNGLHPAVLHDAGLGPAIEDLANRLPVHAGVGEVNRRYRPEIEAAAWFIACEGVANAVKHADADRIDLVLTAQDGILRVRVTDDGCGGGRPERHRPPRHRRPHRSPRWQPVCAVGHERRHDPDRRAAMRVVIADDSVLLREGDVRPRADPRGWCFTLRGLLVRAKSREAASHASWIPAL